MSELRQQTLSGIKWSAIERFSMQGITFVLGLIMARLLTPADFGTIGMLGVFIAISQTFIDSGFGSALVRKLDRTEADFNTVFYFNIVVSLVCYVILFLAAPFVAEFFNYPILKDILRVIAINLCIKSLNSVQYAKFTIKVDFKTTAKCSLIATVISGIFGITLAYNGFGVWSLVYQQICGAVVTTIAVWSFSSWRPKWMYSWESFRNLFSYGSKLLVASLLHTMYANMSSLIIGKFYTAKDLGYYSRGESLATLPCSNITGVLQRVTFPIFSQLQNDDSRLIAVYRKYICITSLAVFFAMALLAALAKPLIIVLITDKWVEAAVFTQILCFAWMFDHICAMNLNILQVKGRSDLFLRLEIIKKTISISILLISIPFGILAICVSRVVYTQIAVFINTYYTGKLFNLGYIAQLKDFSGYFFLAIIAALPAYFLTFSSLPALLTLLIGGMVSALIYFVILKTRKDIYFEELLNLSKEQFSKIRK